MRKPKSRLIAATKLSDYHIKKLIQAYAFGASAAETARHTTLSYLTVRRTFDMLRQRLVELLRYETFNEYVLAMEDAEKNEILYWNENPLLEFISQSRGERRGVHPHKEELHRAEWVFRFVQTRDHGQNYQQAHYAEILKLLRLSGPLNRPLTREGKRRALRYLVARYWEEAQRGKERERERRAAIARNRTPEHEPQEDDDDHPSS